MDIKISGMSQNIHEPRSLEHHEALQQQQDHELKRQKARKEAAQKAEAAASSVNDDIKHLSNMLNRKLEYRIDEELNTIIVKVIDPETDKVIKELPPDELRRIRKRLQETVGLLFDETI